MNKNLSGQHLRESLVELQKAKAHLAFSFERVSKLPGNLEGVTESELEIVEAFCSRFGRLVDILVNKTLRALDRVELFPPGTLLDVVNCAEKRGLIGGAIVLREMKEIRNIIAHDYAGVELQQVFMYCREQTPLLIEISNRTTDYGSRVVSETAPNEKT